MDKQTIINAAKQSNTESYKDVKNSKTSVEDEYVHLMQIKEYLLQEMGQKKKIGA